MMKWVLIISQIFVFADLCSVHWVPSAWGDLPASGAGHKGQKSIQEAEYSSGGETPSAAVEKKGKKRKKFANDKEAEGTQAPNRFEQDLIIKSRYELNGQSLEVDTD